MDAGVNIGGVRRVTRQIESTISAGEVRPGQTLVCGALAAQLDAPFFLVEEAMARLVEDGVLVRGLAGAPMLPFLAAERLAEIAVLRGELEGLAAAEAARRADSFLLNELRSQLAVMRTPHSLEIWAAANRAFHVAIFEAAGFELLVKFIDMLWLACGPHLRAALELAARTKKGADAMEALGDNAQAVIDALARHDARAARAAMAARVSRISVCVAAAASGGAP
ncbi:MAG: FCD domain-containing protein [Hyphomonadaceae bacterium]